MLTPSYLDSLPDSLVELYTEAELVALKDMARRISQYDFYIPAAEHQQKRLLASGTTYDEILKGLSSLTGKSNREITALMKEAGMKTIEADNVVYQAAGRAPKPFLATPAVQAVYKAGLANTKQLFRNLTKTAAYEGSKLLGDTLDLVYMQVTSGAFDLNTATRNAMKQLASNGLPAVKYPSGKTDNIEVAIRRSVLTGVNQTTAKMQLALAADMDCGFVETSAHGGARPTHAAWQGQVFSLGGPKDGYEDFYLVTGYGTGAGLCGWNCKHDFAPFFPGISSPAYSKEVLQDYEAKNYSYKGRAMTEYEVQQKQRYIERTIRKWKREYATMDGGGKPVAEAASKLAQWRALEKDFLAKTGLKLQSDRTMVAGFGKSAAQRAVSVAKTTQKVADEVEKAYNIKQQQIKTQILSDIVPKTLNLGNQNKHIKDSSGFISGRSYIFGDLQFAQALVYTYHGTGEIRLNDTGEWTHKEFIQIDSDIGVAVNHISGVESRTNRFSIHYGKNGAHIVPAKQGRRGK